MKGWRFAIWILVILPIPGSTGFTASASEMFRSYNFTPAGLTWIPGIDPIQNHSSQVLAAQAPVWQQVNSSGFGDQDAGEVSSLENFNGFLYAGTSNPIDGARIFRTINGVTWVPVSEPGFGIAHDIRPPSILDLTVFKGRLYASTGRGDGPGQIWRAVDGATWAAMVIHGFGDPDTVDITALTEFNGFLYAGATNLISGAQIWVSYSGDGNINSWTKAVTPATAGASIKEIAGFNGALYAAVETGGPVQIWRRGTGGAWTAIMSNGFGNSSTMTGGMAEFAGNLYVGAGNAVNSAQLWRTNNGTNWFPVIPPGFGDPNNQKVEMVFVSQNVLNVSVKNVLTGMELWRSPDGTNWTQINQDGFGDNNNSSSNCGHATAEFLGGLYLGTVNTVEGGEVWRMQAPPSLFIPLVLR